MADTLTRATPRHTHRYLTRLQSRHSTTVRISRTDVTDSSEPLLLHSQDMRPGMKLSVYWPGQRESYPCTVIDTNIHDCSDAVTIVCEYDGGVVEHALGTMRFKVLEQPRSDRQAFEEVRRKRQAYAAYQVANVSPMSSNKSAIAPSTPKSPKFKRQLDWLRQQETAIAIRSPISYGQGHRGTIWLHTSWLSMCFCGNQ